MKKAFVTGWPVSQSKSPLLHGYWLKQYSIDGSYEAIAINPEMFSEFLKELPSSGFAGGNITIPHKETAFSGIECCDEISELIGAVNTIWVEEGRSHATNTDAYGFMANMEQYAPDWRNNDKATVLGAGGASRAVIVALIQAGFSEIRIANRTLERAQSLADRFGSTTSAHCLDATDELYFDTDLLVNTTSLGMDAKNVGSIPVLDNLPQHALVTDIVYKPLNTPLLQKAKERGLAVVDGLGMLLHQAVPGFEKWFGKRPEVTQQLREHLLES